MELQSVKTIPYLDGWRGVAILLVLYSHFVVGAGGDLGVALFFVLSGFLVSDLLFQRQTGIGTFFWRRATRILPTFWLYVGIMAACTAWFLPVRYSVPLDEMAATLSFLRTYFPEGQSIWSSDWPIGHLWSLNVEEHAYLVMGLVALLGRILHRPRVMSLAMLGCIGAMCLTIFLYSRTPPDGASPWQLRSECAALGLFASAWMRTSRFNSTHAWIRDGHWAVAPLSLFGGLLCYAPGAPYLAAPGLAPLLLAISINYLDCAPAAMLRFLSLPVLRWLGLCSFSLYMWQQPFYKAMAAYKLPPGVALALVLVVGFGMFHVCENPTRRFLNRMWQLRVANLQLRYRLAAEARQK